jgi:hypothetical protein
MANPPTTVEFDPLDAGEIAERMQAMADAHRGWINFEPRIPDDDEPPEATAFTGLFSNRGPAIPLCTWTSPPRSRKGVIGPQAIGIQHSRGTRAVARLAELNLAVPGGWLVRTDHPKRGMVIDVPADEEVATVLDWLLAAGEALVAVPVTGRWSAIVYDG